MSAEVKKVKEEIKIKTEGLTLKELGLTIPSYLQELGWEPFVNVNTLYQIKGEKFEKGIFALAIDYGFFDFALEIIETADRPDKRGFDPNLPVCVDPEFAPFSALCYLFFKYKNELYDGLAQIADALFSRGALLAYNKFQEYYQSKGIIIARGSSKNPLIHSTPYNMLFDDLPSGDNGFIFIDKKHTEIFGIRPSPLVCRMLAEYWLQSEPLIQNDYKTDTLDKFREKVDKNIPIGLKITLPGPILDLIYSYLPFPQVDFRKGFAYEIGNHFHRENRFDQILPSMRNFFEHYYLHVRKEKDAQFADKIVKIREEEKQENERREQIKLARAKREKEKKQEKEKEVFVDSIEMIRQQNEMLQKQTKIISQLMTMYQDLKNKSGGGSLGLDTRDTRGAVASAVLSLPASGSIKEEFEICEPKPHKQ